MNKRERKCSDDNFKHCINHWQEGIYGNCLTWKENGYCPLEPEKPFYKKAYKWLRNLF